MKKTVSVLLAGFGGQGILFAGKVLASAGLLTGKKVSWLPSYGPEMRGGTANCGVVLSDTEIGSPLVLHPDYLVVMNEPSFERFEPMTAKGGKLIADSSLVVGHSKRPDITESRVDATRLAQENHLCGLANIIMLGRLIRESGILSVSAVQKALAACIPDAKKALLAGNLAALELGCR